VAVQRTVVAPTGNVDADAGEQLVCTGGRPPDTTGGVNVTLAGLLLVAETVTLPGHVMLNAGGCPPGVSGG
jgi:hypothetical protein